MIVRTPAALSLRAADMPATPAPIRITSVSVTVLARTEKATVEAARPPIRVRRLMAVIGLSPKYDINIVFANMRIILYCQSCFDCELN
jgi:hypothetical protein